jgi:hypothetical protein
MTPGSETAVGDQLVYLGPSPDADGRHTVGGDCWSVPLDASAPARPLTHTALAMGCAATTDDVVWTQHADPDHPPADGLFDDPYEVVAAPLTGGPPRVLHEGYLPTGYPEVLADAVIWQTGGRPVVRRLSAVGAAHLPTRTDGAGPGTDGDQLVVLTNSRLDDVTVTIARVR